MPGASVKLVVVGTSKGAPPPFAEAWAGRIAALTGCSRKFRIVYRHSLLWGPGNNNNVFLITISYTEPLRENLLATCAIAGIALTL